MSRPREQSHPPSDPQPARASGFALGTQERPDRIQLGAALLFGFVLVASGLYMWRRPRTADAGTEAEAEAASASAASSAAGAFAAPAASAANSAPVALSDARVLVCQDRGSKKTAPDECDRLAPVEKAMATAITQSASCVGPAGEGGTIEYVADVSFSRQKVNVSLPRAGRSVHDRKALHSCAEAVRGALHGLELDSIDHQHARYKIAVTATYKSSQPGG